MDLLSPIKDHHSEKQLFVARVILSAVIAILMLGVVVVRLVQLQVVEHERTLAASLVIRPQAAEAVSRAFESLRTGSREVTHRPAYVRDGISVRRIAACFMPAV